MYSDICDIKDKFLDIAYDNKSKFNKLDIYRPTKKSNLAAIILVHGGAWLRGDKSETLIHSPIINFVNSDFVVVSINFRLSSEATFPAAIEDVKTAIRFIRKNSTSFGIDEEKIALLGYSVGANMVSLVGATNDSSKFRNDTLSDISDKIKAVISLFGPYDFLKIKDQFHSLDISPFAPNPIEYALKFVENDVEKLINELNPISFLDKNCPPFYVSHGTSDNVVPISQSIELVNKIYEVSNSDVEFHPIIGAKHLDPKFFTPIYMDKMIKFLKKHLLV